ncbi:endonuclease/exonuclease/phosphatase family protein [Aspergillus clavatus NRRL 1]|uniref:Endonuclease/exonuclease/phosphatase family protein n=1 Tax=Aspergillus clavatus (strain ATCC 1007 / CBS 513.65 / DSM 816 / NCTC 3887 / NRRL 1 / QM 1276 / 107) TaxID=344612 RepID=A1CSD7_ASPCL|nr:endonuclease/exonuclease/phosphatase family protein [Aspergillus clavatus NRRL 1]EAW08558.1 endonuclease/exonuclease/phosphatase family protein [Aspergillus clavatus NRRL 1]
MRSTYFLLAGLPSALAAIGGEFNVLTLNVAGLPPIFNGNDVPGDKTENSRLIGKKFAEYGYDVIHVQEDFNYHAAIYETDNHPYRTPTSGGAAIGSGLNTLSNFEFLNFARTKWATCSNASGADCLTPKGFTSMRVRVAEGVYVDFYNMHTDAGSKTEDVAARGANLQQVADYIRTYSVGNAVVVFGDTNARYTSSGEKIRVFQTENGMTNPWVQLVLNGDEPKEGTDPLLCENPSTVNTCETVDKIFYRGSRAIDLQATFWNYESSKFLSESGTILSDHNPVTSNFTWTLSDSIRQSDLWGGPHGTWFNDIESIPSTSTGANKPTKISLRGSKRLDSVGLALASGKSYNHGGTGGTLSELILQDGEHWTRARLCQAKYNDRTRNFYLLATTSAGRSVRAGTATDDCREFVAPEGWQIVGFYGQDGDEMDQLGFIYGLI